MTLQDIALFKEFIINNTLRDIFISHYRRSRDFAKNPQSIEEFLSNVGPEEVLTGSVMRNPKTNATFGYDFWLNTNENWLTFLYQNRRRHSYTDYHKLMDLEGMFKVLRENWDAVKAWLYEDMNKALLRLGLKEIEPEKGEGKEEKVETTLPDVEDFSGVPEYEDDLEFFDVGAGSRSKSTKLKKGQASLNFRSHSYKMTFNQEDTKKLKQNGYKYVRLAKNKQGDIVLQLHKIEGLTPNPVNVTYAGTGIGANGTINSKDLCEKVKVLLNLSGDYFVLKIEELYMDSDKANYKLIK